MPPAPDLRAAFFGMFCEPPRSSRSVAAAIASSTRSLDLSWPLRKRNLQRQQQTRNTRAAHGAAPREPGRMETTTPCAACRQSSLSLPPRPSVSLVRYFAVQRRANDSQYVNAKTAPILRPGFAPWRVHRDGRRCLARSKILEVILVDSSKTNVTLAASFAGCTPDPAQIFT